MTNIYNTPSSTTTNSEPWLAPTTSTTPPKPPAAKKPAAKKPAATSTKTSAEKKREKWWHDPGHGDTGPRHEAQRVRDEEAGFGPPALEAGETAPVVVQGPRPGQNLRRPVGF